MDPRTSVPGSTPYVINVAKAADDEKTRPAIPPLSFTGLTIDTTLRPRSASMHRQLAEHKWNVTPKNGKPFLDDKYLIVDGTNTDFISTDIASIGGSIKREVIILHPKHELLELQFKALTDIIRKFKVQHNTTDTDILAMALLYARQAIQYNEEQTNKLIADAFKDNNKPPRIPLEVFIEHGIGVCRHQALFLAYLIDRLIKEKYLSSYFKVYLHRDDVVAGAHTWVMVRNELTDELLYLDPTNFTSIYNLRIADERQKAFAIMGDQGFIRCMQRYSNNVLPYKEIKNDKDKDEFLLALLDQNIIRLRIFLQLQHAKNALPQIKHALKCDEILKKNINYQQVLTEIVRIERISNVDQFNELASNADKEQFIIALLLKAPHERRVVLQKQNLYSLDQMLKMQSSVLDRVRCELSCYEDLFNEIRGEHAIKKPIEQKKLAQLKLLSELCTAILNTIITGKLTVEPASNCCCSFFSPQPGKEISVGQFKKRIPTEAFQYYEMLAKLQLNSATLEELTALMKKINTAAEKSAKKTDDPNFLFYKILTEKNYREMMRNIKDFNVNPMIRPDL